MHPCKLAMVDIEERIEIEEDHCIKIIDPEANNKIVDPKKGFKCRHCGILRASISELSKHFREGDLKTKSINFLFNHFIFRGTMRQLCFDLEA